MDAEREKRANDASDGCCGKDGEYASRRAGLAKLLVAMVAFDSHWFSLTRDARKRLTARYPTTARAGTDAMKLRRMARPTAWLFSG